MDASKVTAHCGKHVYLLSVTSFLDYVGLRVKHTEMNLISGHLEAQGLKLTV